MKIRYCFSLFFFIILVSAVYSQDWRATSWEFQAGMGSANYFGDIGGAAGDNNLYGIKDFELFRSRLTGVAGLRYNHNRYLSFSGNLALGWLSGSDKGSRNESRDYIFNTIFLEPSGRIEFFIFRDLLKAEGVDNRGLVKNYAGFSAYLFTGAGAIIYSVMPNDRLSNRQERDNIEYAPVTMVLPVGAGVRIGIQNTIDIGLETGGRYALNDYLDGFTSPFSRANDIYYITTINLVYRLDQLRRQPINSGK